MAETPLITRLPEIDAVLKSADGEFAASLSDSIRLLVLHRLFQSTDRKAEFAFLSKSISRIIGEGYTVSTNPQESIPDPSAILGDNLLNESNVMVFSAVTDYLDRVSPKGLYQLASDLRKEPIHCV